MPLNDREQRILEEIERQFYQDDPKLAETVRGATLATLSSRSLKWAVLAFVAGLGIMLGFFTRVTVIALVGFVIMVGAVAWIVAIVKRRSGVGFSAGPQGWVERLRGRWPRGR